MTYRDRLLTCPRCGEPLARRTRRERWPCHACHGVAIELGELIRLLLWYAPDLLPRGGAGGLETVAWPSPRSPINCAACGKPMASVMLHGIKVDRCYQDELVWFDASELDQMIDAAIAGHHARKGWAQKLRELLFAS